MEWRRVQVLRPRVSTSAGQSFVAGASAGEDDAGSETAAGAFIDFAWDAHAEKAILEEQDRHLWGGGATTLANDALLATLSLSCESALISQQTTNNIRLSIRAQHDAWGQRLGRFRLCLGLWYCVVGHGVLCVCT